MNNISYITNIKYLDNSKFTSIIESTQIHKGGFYGRYLSLGRGERFR